jgi:predicted enzyme related to lactoylglutathione lyase
MPEHLFQADSRFHGGEREMMAKISWIEIGAEDVEASRKFYKSLLGLEMPPLPGWEGYYTFEGEEEAVAGLRQSDGEGYMTVYFDVDDVASSLRKAEELGAEVLVEAASTPDGLTFGFFRDLDGNIVGLSHYEAPGE